MPALPPAAQVLRVTLKYTYALDTVVMNRYYFKYGGTAPDNTGLNTMAGNIGASWNTNMAPLTHASCSLTSVTVTDLTSAGAAQGINSSSHPGTRAGTTVPAGTCGIIDFHIQRRYRGGKPRIYLPVGIASDLLNSQTWTTTFQTGLFAGWNAFLSGGTPPAGTTLTYQCNVGYYHDWEEKKGSTGRPYAASKVLATPNIDQITSATVDQRVGSQRRRNRP